MAGTRVAARPCFVDTSAPREPVKLADGRNARLIGHGAIDPPFPTGSQRIGQTNFYHRLEVPHLPVGSCSIV